MKKLLYSGLVLLFFAVAFSSCADFWVPRSECDKQISRANEHMNMFFFFHRQDTLQLDSALTIINALFPTCQERYSDLVEMKLALYILKGQVDEAVTFTDSIKEEMLLPYQTKNLIRNNVLALAASEGGDMEKSRYYYGKMREEIDTKYSTDLESDKNFIKSYARIHYLSGDKYLIRAKIDSLYRVGKIDDFDWKKIQKEFVYFEQDPPLPFVLVAF